jgi:hypothetical protein
MQQPGAELKSIQAANCVASNIDSQEMCQLLQLRDALHAVVGKVQHSEAAES